MVLFGTNIQDASLSVPDFSRLNNGTGLAEYL